MVTGNESSVIIFPTLPKLKKVLICKNAEFFLFFEKFLLKKRAFLWIFDQFFVIFSFLFYLSSSS